MLGVKYNRAPSDYLGLEGAEAMVFDLAVIRDAADEIEKERADQERQAETARALAELRRARG